MTLQADLNNYGCTLSIEDRVIGKVTKQFFHITLHGKPWPDALGIVRRHFPDCGVVENRGHKIVVSEKVK